MSTTRTREGAPAADDVSLEEGRALLDEAALRLLNMTGDEFIAAWDENRITDPDTLRV